MLLTSHVYRNRIAHIARGRVNLFPETLPKNSVTIVSLAACITRTPERQFTLPFDHSSSLMKYAFLSLLLLIGVAEAQQEFALTEGVPDAPSVQRFWNTENKIDFSIFAAQLAADAITTQRGLSRGFREVNPLLRPLVKRGAAGQTAATVLSFGTGVGAMYLLHATHHYRAERIALRLVLAGEGALVGHNIALLR
jgi:Domain of unknown function (DUF5658)